MRRRDRQIFHVKRLAARVPFPVGRAVPGFQYAGALGDAYLR